MKNTAYEGGGSLGGLDYWRLSEELSVIDASFLTLNLDPGCFQLSNLADPANSKIIRVAEFEDWEARALYNGDIPEVELEPNQFRAVFKALRNAVLNNKLRANVVTRGREPSYAIEENTPDVSGRIETEEMLNYQFLVGRGTPQLFSNSINIQNVETSLGGEESEHDVIYILKEPDWSETKLAVDDVKDWYASRGLYPEFFFWKGLKEGFRDANNPRYSAKLATAVAAWETVKKAGKNKSVKQSLLDWVVGNGVQFGLGNNESVVTPTVAEEVAKIANWHPGGGATKTATGDEDDENESEQKVPIQNFQEIDGQIPF
ncbi:hypothetical protein ACFE33_12885 [Falsihalocynthiibacter sp. SS001]|uniref:hypothetical protein n=1 Tax=Falsihalocynthiibacter sp. SS001 TaxID=3349698 RepID=UPI0036D41E10